MSEHARALDPLSLSAQMDVGNRVSGEADSTHGRWKNSAAGTS